MITWRLLWTNIFFILRLRVLYLAQNPMANGRKNTSRQRQRQLMVSATLQWRWMRGSVEAPMNKYHFYLALACSEQISFLPCACVFFFFFPKKRAINISNYSKPTMKMQVQTRTMTKAKAPHHQPTMKVKRSQSPPSKSINTMATLSKAIQVQTIPHAKSSSISGAAPTPTRGPIVCVMTLTGTSMTKEHKQYTSMWNWFIMITFHNATCQMLLDFIERSYPCLVSAVHAKTSRCTNSLLYACYRGPIHG